MYVHMYICSELPSHTNGMIFKYMDFNFSLLLAQLPTMSCTVRSMYIM